MEIEEWEKLLVFLKLLQKKDVQDICIVGFFDDIGMDDYNLWFFEECVKQIVFVIMDNGLEVDYIYMEGKGEVKDEIIKVFNCWVEVKIRVLEQCQGRVFCIFCILYIQYLCKFVKLILLEW